MTLPFYDKGSYKPSFECLGGEGLAGVDPSAHDDDFWPVPPSMTDEQIAVLEALDKGETDANSN